MAFITCYSFELAFCLLAKNYFAELFFQITNFCNVNTTQKKVIHNNANNIMPFSDLKTLIIPKMFISKINEDYGKGKVPLSRSLLKIIGCSHEIKYPCVAREGGRDSGARARAYGASVEPSKPAL